VGACSGLMQGMFDVHRVALIARVLAGLVLICVGIGVLFKWRPLAVLERLGAGCGATWRLSRGSFRRGAWPVPCCWECCGGGSPAGSFIPC
jgi:hypothetical protein